MKKIFIVMISVTLLVGCSSKKVGNESNSNSNKDSNSNIESNLNIESNHNVESNVSSNIVSNNTSNKKSNSNTNSNVKSKTFTATFIVPSGTQISESKVSCTTTENSCVITTPVAAKSGYEVDGYTTVKNSNKIQVKENTKVKINKDVTYYLVLKIPIKATFIKNKADDPKTVVKTCYVYKKGDSCKIKVPRYYKTGSYDNTWSLKKNDNSPYIESDTIVSINKNTTYYAQYHNGWYRPPQANWREDRNVSVGKIYTIGDTRIEYEKGIPNDICLKHYKFIQKAYKKFPWYFRKGKIMVLTKDTYSKISTAYGLTTYSYIWYSIDLQYTGSEISEGATLHELGHVLDEHYAYLNGKDRSIYNTLERQPEIEKFYNKVHEAGREPQILSEWMPAIITDWMWHYKHLDDTKPYYSAYEKYTSAEKKEIMQLMEKYMNYVIKLEK